MAISLKEYIPDTAANSYWDGADSSKCPIVDSEKYTTFSKGAGEYRLDISSIKETAGGVFIKYNTYNAGDAASLSNAELTIKSIKLIKDPASVSTQSPGTTDKPNTTEEPGKESPTKAPDLRPGIDLSGTKALYGNGTVEAEKDKVTGTDVEGLLIPLGFNVDNGRSVKITVYGEASEGTRIWLSDDKQVQYSVIQNPMAFQKEYTLTADKSQSTSSSSYAAYIQIKGSTPGAKMDSITITKIVAELMGVDETPEPKATLAPGMVDLTKPYVIGGKGAYDDLAGQFVINDSEGTESQVFFDFPDSVGTVASGDTVTVTIKGNYSGENGFRVWIGSGSSALSDVKMFDSLAKGEFTETFDLKATDKCTRVTIKSVTQPSAKAIDGLAISSIKLEKK